VIRVIEDVLGTRIAGARVDGRTVELDIRREPMTRADWTTHDYNTHFSFGLENSGSSPAEIEVRIEGGTWDGLPEKTPLLYASPRREGPYGPASFDARTDRKRRYAIRLRLEPGERIFLANTLVRDPLAVAASCDEAAAAAGGERLVYGRSLQHRDLVAYRFAAGGPTRGDILVTSGFHQPEPDTLATEAILRWLASAEAAPVRRQFDVTIVPFANPDGHALGTQGSNAAGVNLYWLFGRDDPARCAEAVALWRLASSLEPIGYIDFHSYTFQLDKSRGPYLKPLSHYRTQAVRAAAGRLSRLVADLGTVPVTGFGAFAPSTLTAMLTARFDTLTLAKYHLHLKDGADECRAHGVAVFRAMTDALESAGVTAAGRRPGSAWRGAARSAESVLAGLLRPALGHWRRGSAFDLTRSRIIEGTQQ
jgi:hypothetical protein